ncbi:MAG: CotH kinase family protein [Clostridia bacterium]|nr:CotH kinase family protein [Clostridia bacterium]
MKPLSSRRLLISLSLLFAFFILALSLFFFFLGKGAYGGVFSPDTIDFSLSLNGQTVLSPESGVLLPAGDHRLTLTVEEPSPLFVYLLCDGKPLYEGELYEKETVLSASLEKESRLSVLFMKEAEAKAYLSTSSDLAFSLKKMRVGGDLTFLEDLGSAPLSLQAPFRLFGIYSFEEITVETALSAPIVLCPSVPASGALYVNAPAAMVYYRNFTPSFTKTTRDLYLKAAGCNGDALDPLYYPVSSLAELERLADPAALPRLQENGSICFLAPVSLQKSLSFTCHANLSFLAQPSFGAHALIFSTPTEGEFSVTVDGGISVPQCALRFDAPRSGLTWSASALSGLSTAPVALTVEKYNNLAFYNGSELALGGEGKAVPTLAFYKTYHPSLEEDIVFTAEGNLLTAALPFSMTLKDLEGLSHTLVSDGGTCHLVGTLSDGYVLTVDENGLEHRYGIAARREAKGIPVVYLETENGAAIDSKSQYVSATIMLDSVDPALSSLQETHIRIRGRGNSTWKWDKKPYKIHFDEPVALFGLPAGEEWALFANFADKTLMRNRLAQIMSEELSFAYTPSHVYVDVFLNGEYLGIYGLGEHLEEGEGRVEVPHDPSALDCGFFMEAGGVVAGVDVKGMNYFHTDLLKFVLIKGPEFNALTSEQFSYIRDYVQKACDAVVAGDGYEEYIDMESFIDWLIMIELSNNVDCAYRRSTYITKAPGGKLVFGPMWDFDLAFGNFSKDEQAYNVWVSTSEDDYVGTTWSTYLLEDPEFRAMFKRRWLEVRDSLLEAAFAEIETGYEKLAPSAEENFIRWDILGKKVAFEPFSTKYYPTFESNIEYLTEFLEDRAAWISAQVKDW